MKSGVHFYENNLVIEKRKNNINDKINFFFIETAREMPVRKTDKYHAIFKAM